MDGGFDISRGGYSRVIGEFDKSAAVFWAGMDRQKLESFKIGSKVFWDTGFRSVGGESKEGSAWVPEQGFEGKDACI